MQAVLHVCAFEDNYIWIVRGRSHDRAALVDPGDAAPVLAALPGLGLRPSAILCTHHHGDHTGGIAELLHHFPGLPVYGPAREEIPGITQPLIDGDEVRLEDLDVTLQVLDVPGHTRGHITYYGHGWLFCGDTLFSAGCGRLFEGTAAQMHASLTRLAALPAETQVFCAHEYTQANLRFARAVEPDNPAIRTYQETIGTRRIANLPTVPSSLAREKDINPFLRSQVAAVRAAAENHAGRVLADDVAVFAEIRKWKDRFRG